MAKFISSTKLSDTLTLSLYTDGYWVYDTTQKMNLSMHAKTEIEALVEVVTYYQERFTELLTEHATLTAKVDHFVSQFAATEDDDS